MGLQTLGAFSGITRLRMHQRSSLTTRPGALQKATRWGRRHTVLAASSTAPCRIASNAAWCVRPLFPWRAVVSQCTQFHEWCSYSFCGGSDPAALPASQAWYLLHSALSPPIRPLSRLVWLPNSSPLCPQEPTTSRPDVQFGVPWSCTCTVDQHTPMVKPTCTATTALLVVHQEF